jgi:spore coat polysaccharide biosynthesis predicted glycosyltransferase SpsG
VLEALHDTCRERGIELEVVLGRGYADPEGLAAFPDVRIDRAVVDMADRIRAADIVVTSAGRTVFEIACLGTPGIVLAQNARELTHFFASSEHGFLNLGLGTDVSLDRLESVLVELADHPDMRREMQRRMLDNDLRSGTERVVRLIHRTVERHVAR